MPVEIKIYPEGNVIALKTGSTPDTQHTGNLNDANHGLGYINITDLHDPAKRPALREQVAGYFAKAPVSTFELGAIYNSGADLIAGVMASRAEAAGTTGAKEAAKKAFLELVDFVPAPEATSVFESFWSAHGDSFIHQIRNREITFGESLFGKKPDFPELEKWWQGVAKSLPPGKEAGFYQRLLKAKPSAEHLGTGYKSLTAVFNTVEEWRHRAENPLEAADALLADIDKHKETKYAFPTQEIITKGKKYRDQLSQCLDHLPAAARSVIDADGLHVVIGDAESEVTKIVPRAGGFRNIISEIFNNYGGFSYHNTLYLPSGFSKAPHLVAEEILHQIDYKLDRFTAYEPWKLAVQKDIGGVKGNRVANKLIKLYRQTPLLEGQSAKMNGTFTADSERFEGERFAEALPDIMHYERIAEKELAAKGKIKKGMFSSVRTVDEAMENAFPNIWKMYRGAPAGHQLQQVADGTIHVVKIGNSIPGGQLVTSFVEACESFTSAATRTSDVTGASAMTEHWLGRITAAASKAAHHISL